MDADDTAEIESSLRALGAQADATENPSQFTIPEETADPSSAPAETPNPDAEDKGQTPAAKVDSSKSESAEPAAEKEQAPKSKYQKAQERAAEAWKKIEAEKAEIARQKAEIETARQQVQRPPEKTYRPEEYENAASNAEKAAKDAELMGDEEEAKTHRANADEFRQQANLIRHQQMVSEWQSMFDATAKELNVLDALKSKDSPEGKEVLAILKEHQELGRFPGGAKIALKLWNATREAAAASALKTKNEELTKEVERLTKATSSVRTGPSKANSETPKSDLNERDLRAMAAQWDEEHAA